MIRAGAPSREDRRAAEQRESRRARASNCFTTMSCWPMQLVHDEPRAPLAALDHHDLAVARRPREPAPAPLPHDVAQVEQREHLVAQHAATSLPLHVLHHVVAVLERLAHVRERQRVPLRARPREQRAHDRERDRQADRDRRALAHRRSAARRSRRARAPSSAPRRSPRRAPRGPDTCSAVEKPGVRDEPEQRVVVELAHRPRPRARARGARGEHAAAVDARGRRRSRGSAPPPGRAPRSAPAARRAASRPPRARAGGSMPWPDRVAQEVHDRLADLVEQRAVELDLLPLDDEVDVLVRAAAPRRARGAESGRTPATPEPCASS